MSKKKFTAPAELQQSIDSIASAPATAFIGRDSILPPGPANNAGLEAALALKAKLMAKEKTRAQLILPKHLYNVARSKAKASRVSFNQYVITLLELATKDQQED